MVFTSLTRYLLVATATPDPHKVTFFFTIIILCAEEKSTCALWKVNCSLTLSNSCHFHYYGNLCSILCTFDGYDSLRDWYDDSLCFKTLLYLNSLFLVVYKRDTFSLIVELSTNSTLEVY